MSCITVLLCFMYNCTTVGMLSSSSIDINCSFAELILFLFCTFNSKLQSDVLREAVSQIKKDTSEKKRNFTETIELQIGLKNYDPQKDKRFSGSVKLPHIPRPKMKVCMLGDAQHVEEVRYFCNCIGSFYVPQI